MNSPRRTRRDRSPTEIELYRHQEIELLALTSNPYELILSVGGVGSGKTTGLFLWLLDRMQWDTGQMHALFAHTSAQLRAVTRVIYKMLDRVEWVRNHERIFNCRPPKAWQREWARRGIETPVRQDRYENVVIWPSGLHLQLGTVHNRSYEQYRGSEWGSLALEEFTLQGVTRDAFDFLDERVRCGEGEDGVDCSATLGHRHTKILHGNPPETPDHWSWDLFEALERQAANFPGGIERHDGDDGFPNLIRGIGPAILIPSRTTDNVRLGKTYVVNKLARLDRETADRRLGGALKRTREGRVYNAFSHLNEIATFDYDPNRELYVSLDFNRQPAVATFHQTLRPGEYPEQPEGPAFEHVGTFGTFFHIGGINAEQLCAMLLTGERGNQSNLPEHWRGLLAHNTRIVFYGDATSTYERMAGNEWEIVDRVCGSALEGRYSRDVPEKRNPLVAVSAYAVNAKCLNALGVRSYWMHPRNTELRLDLTTNRWDKTGKDILKVGYRPGSSSKEWQRGHAGDTLRYFLSRRFPLGGEVSHEPEDALPQMRFGRFHGPRMQ